MLNHEGGVLARMRGQRLLAEGVRASAEAEAAGAEADREGVACAVATRHDAIYLNVGTHKRVGTHSTPML